MTEVRTLFADPSAVFVDGEHGTWLVAGVATNRLRDIVATADGVRDVEDELASRAEDAVVVFASSTDRGGRVAAFRSATSSRDVFYLEASDGTLVLTDHFRNAVSQLAVEDRTVDRTAVADHLLFRSPVGPSTYVSEIGRVGRGECVRWDGAGDDWTRTLVDTLDHVDRYGPSTAVDELDEALTDALKVGARPNARTMLSGGVDSTLLASYRRDAPPPVQMTVDTPEFQSEVAAGRDAADLLEADREVVALEESSFLDYLEATVDALGQPPGYNQTVVTAASFRLLDGGQYVNGQAADALFGLPGVKAARVADWLGRAVCAGPIERLADATDGGLTAGHDAVACRRRQLQRPPSNPKSLAQALASDLDADAVAEVFDRRVVQERARNRLEHATDRSPLDADATFAGQAAAGHLVEYLCCDAVNRWRQLGFARGQAIVAPFRTRRVAQTALAVPADRRYVSGARTSPRFTGKYIPKRLLTRRLADYAVHREKGAGSLPIERYVTDGPLRSAFDRYEPPAFLTPDSYERNVEEFGPLTWELLTYSVWRDRILFADDLDVVPGTRTRYLRLPADPPAPPT